MVNAFKSIDVNNPIEFQVIDPRGKVEPGKGIGASRDVYSSVWRDILDSLFIGDRERVPYVRHDMYFEEWEAIGKMLAKGYFDTGFFPIMVCQAFLVHCLYNEVHNDVLIDSFLKFLSVKYLRHSM